MTALNPLHTKVSEANDGDAGWVYYRGDWCLAQITRSGTPEDDSLYVDIILVNDDTLWFEFNDPVINNLPWVPISRPPYDGDEMPCTHLLHLQSREGSATLSFRVGNEEGREFDKKVFTYARTLLKEEHEGVTADAV